MLGVSEFDIARVRQRQAYIYILTEIRYSSIFSEETYITRSCQRFVHDGFSREANGVYDRFIPAAVGEQELLS